MARQRVILIIEQTDQGAHAYFVTNKGAIIGSETQLLLSSAINETGQYDGLALLYCVRSAITKLLQKTRYSAKSIEGIGLLNQPYSFLVWDKLTGQPLSPVISADSRVTHMQSELLRRQTIAQDIVSITGMPISHHSMATKIKWLIKESDVVSTALKRSEAVVGSLDTWLLYHMTGKQVIKTDYGNAGFTQLFSRQTVNWDPFLLKEFGLKKKHMATVVPSASLLGTTSGFVPLLDGTPILGSGITRLMAHYGCHGMMIGSGSICLGDTHHFMGYLGKKSVPMDPFSSVIHSHFEGPYYSAELHASSIMSMMSWLERFDVTMASMPGVDWSFQDARGLFVIPSGNLFSYHVGESSPYTLVGLIPGLEPRHLIAAATLSVAHQLKTLVMCYEEQCHTHLSELSVFGPLSSLPKYVQALSDILQLPLVRFHHSHPEIIGMASFVGKQSGFLTTDLAQLNKIQTRIVPLVDPLTSYSLHESWCDYDQLFRKSKMLSDIPTFF